MKTLAVVLEMIFKVIFLLSWAGLWYSIGWMRGYNMRTKSKNNPNIWD
jgi:hypothetical protein